jgi:hypothetical protein
MGIFFQTLLPNKKSRKSFFTKLYLYYIHIKRKKMYQKNGENNTDIFKGLTQIFALGLDIHWTRPDCILSKIWV